ncbi:MAG: hypothetical protein KatS3mg114_0438 [Planctomycetaceae bacterium]|nr:MAG: hypothetical protein KatS3mg114_0438 [Planctomycetaceae bacterium]
MALDYDIDDLEDEDSFLDHEGHDEEELESDYDGEELANFEDIDFAALGIDPTQPTSAKPGSEEKVLMLAARYAAGLPLWHEKDCYDHGPGETMARLLRQNSQPAES